MYYIKPCFVSDERYETRDRDSIQPRSQIGESIFYRENIGVDRAGQIWHLIMSLCNYQTNCRIYLHDSAAVKVDFSMNLSNFLDSDMNELSRQE